MEHMLVSILRHTRLKVLRVTVMSTVPPSSLWGFCDFLNKGLQDNILLCQENAHIICPSLACKGGILLDAELRINIVHYRFFFLEDLSFILSRLCLPYCIVSLCLLSSQPHSGESRHRGKPLPPEDTERFTQTKIIPIVLQHVCDCDSVRSLNVW